MNRKEVDCSYCVKDYSVCQFVKAVIPVFQLLLLKYSYKKRMLIF